MPVKKEFLFFSMQWKLCLSRCLFLLIRLCLFRNSTWMKEYSAFPSCHKPRCCGRRIFFRSRPHKAIHRRNIRRSNHPSRRRSPNTCHNHIRNRKMVRNRNRSMDCSSHIHSRDPNSCTGIQNRSCTDIPYHIRTDNHSCRKDLSSKDQNNFRRTFSVFRHMNIRNHRNIRNRYYWLPGCPGQQHLNTPLIQEYLQHIYYRSNCLMNIADQRHPCLPWLQADPWS